VDAAAAQLEPRGIGIAPAEQHQRGAFLNPQLVPLDPALGAGARQHEDDVSWCRRRTSLRIHDQASGADEARSCASRDDDEHEQDETAGEA
jgi:hypothetical protein